MRDRRIIVLIAATALTLPACGDNDGRSQTAATTRPANQTPEALAGRATGPNRNAATGRIDGRLEATVTDERGARAPVAASMTGPFRHRAGSALPDYAIQIQLGERTARLLSVNQRSYIALDTTGYPLPARVRARLTRTSARGRNGLTRTLEQFGIAPWRWETHARVAGAERVDAVPCVRVDTGVDVPLFLRDVNTLAGLLTSLGVTRAAGLPAHLSRRTRRILARSVRSASGSSWIGASDGVLRKAGLRIEFVPSKADRARLGQISRVVVNARLAVTGVGRPQEIAPPEHVLPFHNFALLIDALGDFADAHPKR